MTDDQPLGMRTVRLQATGHEVGGGGTDDHIGRGMAVDFGQKAPLQVLALGRAFLQEVGLRGERM